MFGISELGSSMTKKKLAHLRCKFKVPQDVFFWVPGKDERADQPPEGCIVVGLNIMEVEFYFPLFSMIC